MNSILKFVVLGRSRVSSPGGTSIAYQRHVDAASRSASRESGFVVCWHAQQLGGESLLPNLMEVKG